ncbi:CHRD protein [Aurantiacibacter gangjinensis]|uniref:CHRD protein n=1 Tax=Aurantiacibacter gangjinensis TaxID=502682 RepID=A0A0G9MN92_9SPHN|nr:CHRD protein [Aurantiacibacter gangjinensis]
MRLKTVGLAAFTLAAMGLAGCETIEEAYLERTSVTYEAELRGSNQVGRGDPDGYATAEITFADELTRVCWDLNDIAGLGPITGAHIHRGAAGQNGPVVLAFRQATEGGWRGCSSDTDWVQSAFDEGLSNYYVNVHTAEYPDGAIRGQLRQ